MFLIRMYNLCLNAIKTRVRAKKGHKMRYGFQEGVVYLVHFYEDDNYTMVSYVQEYMCIYRGYDIVQLNKVGGSDNAAPKEVWGNEIKDSKRSATFVYDTKNKCFTSSEWFA